MIDVHEVEAPSTLTIHEVDAPDIFTIPDAKPSQLLRSVPLSRWTKFEFRSEDGHMCAMGHLLDHAGVKWDDDSSLLTGEYADLLYEAYGLYSHQCFAVITANDAVGLDAAIEYLESIGK